MGVRGRAVDRVNRGRLGPKDLFGWQGDNSPDRLPRPLIRRRGKGVSLDWEILAQSAQGAKEVALLHPAQRCLPQSLRGGGGRAGPTTARRPRRRDRRPAAAETHRSRGPDRC